MRQLSVGALLLTYSKLLFAMPLYKNDGNIQKQIYIVKLFYLKYVKDTASAKKKNRNKSTKSIQLKYIL